VLFILLFLSGAESIFGFEFELSETVLIALITGVTVNILAFFLSVMNNLFPNKLPATAKKTKTAAVKAALAKAAPAKTTPAKANNKATSRV
jgi:hypothetical protein